MEDRALLALVVLGVAVAAAALWPRIDRALDWCADHLTAAPAALCTAGLAMAVPGFILGAVPVALAGVAEAVSGGVIHRVQDAGGDGRQGSGRRREGTVAP